MKDAFNIEGAKPEGVTCDAFLRAIRRRANLRRKTAYFPGQGYSAYTVRIGDRIYKTARIDNLIPDERLAERIAFREQSIEREYKILCHLKGKGLPVPEPGDWEQDPPFFDMAFKAGLQLDQDVLDKMTEQERRQIAKDLAKFMTELPNKISAEDAKELGIEGDAMTAPHERKPEDFKALLNDPAVAKALGSNLDFCRQMQTAFAKKYEEEYRNRPMVVSHGDLLPSNILYDPETRRIDVDGEGCLIDFGCCRFLRPAQGCSVLVQNYKDDFVAMVCEEYSNQTGSKLSLRDLKAWDCAEWVSNVKVAQDTVEDENQLQAVLNKIAKLKESIASPEMSHVRDMPAQASHSPE